LVGFGNEALSVSDTGVRIGDNTAASARLHCLGGTSTAGSAPLKIDSGTNLTTPETGAVEFDGDRLYHTNGAAIREAIQGVIFTQTATGTVANTTTETSFVSTGVGTLTLPANFFVAGKTIRVKGYGFHTTSGTPTLRVKLKIGSTIVLDTGVQTSTAASNDGFTFEGLVTCRTTGATGTVFGQGYYIEKLTSPGAVNNFAWTNTATTTIDTTASSLIDVTVQWGTANASNTISLTNLTVEVIN
jgi:hypothetical protein